MELLLRSLIGKKSVRRLESLEKLLCLLRQLQWMAFLWGLIRIFPEIIGK